MDPLIDAALDEGKSISVEASILVKDYLAIPAMRNIDEWTEWLTTRIKGISRYNTCGGNSRLKFNPAAHPRSGS